MNIVVTLYQLTLYYLLPELNPSNDTNDPLLFLSHYLSVGEKYLDLEWRL